MFGDALTTSDAQRLLDALKGTRLAFQCAHGRPTVAPLADLDAMAHQHAEDERAAMEARPRLTLGRMRARCAASRC
jgi:DNA mismatch repair protein MLH3